MFLIFKKYFFIFLVLIFIPTKAFANDHVKVINLYNGNILVSITSINILSDGIRLNLSIINNTSDSFTIYKDNFSLSNVEDVKFSPSLNPASDILTLSSESKSEVSFVFKDITPTTAPFTLSGTFHKYDQTSFSGKSEVSTFIFENITATIT